MRKMLLLGMGLFVICSLCLSNSAYAAWGGWVQTKQERAEAEKRAKEVDLPVLKDRANFLKQKLGELQAQGQKEINSGDELAKSTKQVLRTLNEIEKETGLPCRIEELPGFTHFNKTMGKNKYNISTLILKLDETIAVIDSIIGKNIQGK